MATQILAFSASNTGAGALTQIPATPDENFVQQGTGNWRFYEPFNLLAAATITAAQWIEATWTGINQPQLYPPNLNLNPPSNPQIIDFRQSPIAIPQNEDVGLQLSGGAGGAEYETGLMFITPQSGVQPIPQSSSPVGSMGRVRMLFNVTLTHTVTQWTPDAKVNVQNLYKGGTYLLLGLTLINAKAAAFRCNFPMPSYSPGGKKLSPGGLVENAYGNIPLDKGINWLGPMGFFDTNEFFQLACLATATQASATYTGYLDALWMSTQLLGSYNPPNI
jgi:hypothetical protein